MSNPKIIAVNIPDEQVKALGDLLGIDLTKYANQPQPTSYEATEASDEKYAEEPTDEDSDEITCYECGEVSDPDTISGLCNDCDEELNRQFDEDTVEGATEESPETTEGHDPECFGCKDNGPKEEPVSEQEVAFAQFWKDTHCEHCGQTNPEIGQIVYDSRDNADRSDGTEYILFVGDYDIGIKEATVDDEPGAEITFTDPRNPSADPGIVMLAFGIDADPQSIRAVRHGSLLNIEATDLTARSGEGRNIPVETI